LAKNSLLASKTFHVEEPVELFNVEGAVTAFSHASVKILDQLVDWVRLERGA
jgi:ABC-type uncharacterized transport system auxiliary subunit